MQTSAMPCRIHKIVVMHGKCYFLPQKESGAIVNRNFVAFPEYPEYVLDHFRTLISPSFVHNQPTAKIL